MTERIRASTWTLVKIMLITTEGNVIGLQLCGPTIYLLACDEANLFKILFVPLHARDMKNNIKQTLMMRIKGYFVFLPMPLSVKITNYVLHIFMNVGVLMRNKYGKRCTGFPTSTTKK